MTNKPLLSCAAALVVAGFVFGGTPQAHARTQDDRFVPNHTPGTPLLAVVGLAEQRISIYDAKGKILESPVSSGQTGYETPAGIYSIVQKEEDHHSNLYDDASMPFMERITWTGMALHAGVLPGYPASHGCVRLPHDFAERLYDLTNVGMRVVVAREDIAPVEVSQPFLFGAGSKTPRAERSLRDGVSPTRYSPSANDEAMSPLRMALAKKSAEAQNAARRAKDARLAAAKSASEAQSAARSVQAAESGVAKAEDDVKAIEQALEKADPDKAAQLTETTVQALKAAQAQRDAAKAQAKSKADAAAQAEADAKAAEAALAIALDASEEARLDLMPVSVFVSRKTMRLYVRKANLPVYEAPVMIRDPGKPIGSFVFTALEFGRRIGRHEMECRVPVQERRQRRALLKGEAGLCKGTPAGAGRRRGGRGGSQPPDRFAGSDRLHIASGVVGLFADHLGRRPEHRNRQGHRFCGLYERRAAGRHRNPGAPSRRGQTRPELRRGRWVGIGLVQQRPIAGAVATAAAAWLRRGLV